jgi:hypothetical protein
MRLIGMLAFVVLWLAFGFVPSPASAEPCPFHTHEAAAVEHRAHGMVAAVAPGGPGQAVAVAAPDLLGAAVPHPDTEHRAPPIGKFCCHAATAATLAYASVVEPHHLAASRMFLPGWLPPWAAPTIDVYRPPAFA